MCSASSLTRHVLTAVLALLAAPAPAAAQYPQRPVTLVVPFPAGGATDLIARLLGNELHEKLGQPFVVENRPGAGTTLAATAVARGAGRGDAAARDHLDARDRAQRLQVARL